MTDPRPDYIGPREGAQVFLERETSASPERINRWLSLSAQGGMEPYPDKYGIWAYITYRLDGKFEITLTTDSREPTYGPPGSLSRAAPHTAPRAAPRATPLGGLQPSQERPAPPPPAPAGEMPPVIRRAASDFRDGSQAAIGRNQMQMAVPRVSALLTNVVQGISRTPVVSAQMAMFRTRADEFPSPLAADLAGIYMNERARMMFYERVAEQWSFKASRPIDGSVKEHVLGGGVHGSIYAASRAAMGHPQPVVWEAADVGGAFSPGGGKPVFRLQSRNRPGIAGIPEYGNLNYLPGAVIQPTHLTGAEYPDNAVLRFCIWATLAAYADVRFGRAIGYGGTFGRGLEIEGQGLLKPGRIIDARGMGTDSALTLPPLEQRPHIMTYQGFMNRMGGQFPLRGVRRAAVIGSGASGKSALASLLGIGPTAHYSTAELDWVEQIDWYTGDTDFLFNRESWAVKQSDSASMEIGRYLKRTNPARDSQSRRVRTFSRAAAPVDGPAAAMIDNRSYDLVVVCAGLARRDDRLPDPSLWGETRVPGSGAAVGRRFEGREIYAVGPVTKLPLSSGESTRLLIASNVGNSVSILRYAPKTAALAMALD
jgi:hypothetical protein